MPLVRFIRGNFRPLLGVVAGVWGRSVWRGGDRDGTARRTGAPRPEPVGCCGSLSGGGGETPGRGNASSGGRPRWHMPRILFEHHP